MVFTRALTEALWCSGPSISGSQPEDAGSTPARATKVLGDEVETEYYAVCEEHDVPLNLDGTCPMCKDADGQPFVIDMQSYYLVPVVEKIKS